MKGVRDEAWWWVTYFAAMGSLAGLFLAPSGTIQIAAIVGLAIATVTHSRADRWQRSKANPHDVALYANLLKDLPSETLQFLRMHDFGIPFHRISIKPLEEFEERWQQATHEFVDPELEQCRQTLLVAVQKFLEGVAETTVFLNEGPYLTVYPDYRRDDAKNGERPPDIIADEKRLSKAAKAVQAPYEKIVRLAREKLHTAAA